MHWSRALLGLAAAGVLVFAGAAGAGVEGFVARTALHPVAGSPEPGGAGTVHAWLRVRGDGTVVQSFVVTLRGFFEAEGATLWMALPGDVELEEVGEFATYAGTGRFQVGSGGAGAAADLPLGVESVLKLAGAPVEVRIPGVDLEDEIALRGTVGVFRFGPIGATPAGIRSRRSRMLRPPPPAVPVDESARGFVRLWVDRRPGGTEFQGVSVFARDMTADATYEVWLEDGAGDMQFVDEVTTTADGAGLFVLDGREGDTLPPEAGVDDVRDLFGRRVEFRRAGDTEYALVGLCPRVR